MDARYPIYALADLTVQSREVPHDKIVDEIIAALGDQLLHPTTTSNERAEGGMP